MRPKEKKRYSGDMYQRIVTGVVCGRIRPGERLGENSLSTRFGSPRGAVREALTRLEQDGLVVRKDNVGTYVREIEDDELLEIYDVRIAIEPLVAARVVKIASKAELDELEEIAKQIDRISSVEMNRDALDNAFHQRLAEISGLKHIPHLMRIGNLHARCSALQQKMVISQAQLTRPISQPDHRQIVEALRSGDPDTAASTVAEHLRSARKNAVAEIERIRSVMASLEGGG
jgi:DNA-binding GntR family transcriptional regulator